LNSKYAQSIACVWII